MQQYGRSQAQATKRPLLFRDLCILPRVIWANHIEGEAEREISTEGEALRESEREPETERKRQTQTQTGGRSLGAYARENTGPDSGYDSGLPLKICAAQSPQNLLVYDESEQ